MNGPAATVVSGDPEALAEFEAELSARHVLRWPVPASDFVAHSPRVEGLAGVLAAELAGVRPAAGRVPLFSTVQCGWADGTGLDAGYWYDNVRQTVRFAESVRALAADGYRVFVEVSAHPVLTAAVTETAEDAGHSVLVAGTLDREDAGAARLLSALARMHVHGPRVDWAAVLGGGRRVDLPTYAFQRQRFWPESAIPAGVPVAGGDGPGPRPRRGSGPRSRAGTWRRSRRRWPSRTGSGWARCCRCWRPGGAASGTGRRPRAGGTGSPGCRWPSRARPAVRDVAGGGPGRAGGGAGPVVRAGAGVPRRPGGRGEVSWTGRRWPTRSPESCRCWRWMRRRCPATRRCPRGWPGRWPWSRRWPEPAAAPGCGR